MSSEDEAFDHVERLVKKGDLLALRTWLEDGGDPNSTNRFGWTLLMLAAMHGRTEFVEALLGAGADSTRLNQFGDTAESLAAVKGHRRTAERIVQATGKMNGPQDM
jgi:uncharacterized protein